MFVAMGLSAVFPVLHGIELYGFQKMRDGMGLTWLLLEGFLYILGAGLYAVSPMKTLPSFFNTDRNRRAGLSEPGQARLIFGEVRIRYSMSLWFWQPLHICMVC